MWAASSFAASHEETCAAYSAMAKLMAEQRDSGVPMSAWSERIDGLEKNYRSLTPSNITYMRNLLLAVYHDLRTRTPEQLGLLTSAVCLNN
jgi:hypothetical protein